MRAFCRLDEVVRWTDPFEPERSGGDHRAAMVNPTLSANTCGQLLQSPVRSLVMVISILALPPGSLLSVASPDSVMLTFSGV